MKFYIRYSGHYFSIYPENQVQDARESLIQGQPISVGTLTELKDADVKDMAHNVGEVVKQIKFLRGISGLGLKESKDAIEACNKNPEKILEIYMGWLKNTDLEGSPAGVKTDLLGKIIAGVTVAIENYKVLGFISPISAAQMVLDNLRE